ncbi:ATP-binding protein [Undibacterium arcticum]|uniref:ATP-binding protein n=1 Tax=Undibacterium arcticum TaxID=1762892 RepID=UPI00360926B2
MNTLVIRDIGLLELLDSHAGGRVVWTPQVEQLGLAIAEWMMLGLPGGAAYGQQRCGKSMALTFLKRTMSEYVNVPTTVFLWNIGESLRPVPEPTLLRGFLSETGYMLTSHKDRSVLMTRLVHFIVQNCEAEAARRALILVDEAQNIHFSNYGVLIELFNLLERENCRPFIMLVGQPELALVPETILDENKLHVYGRFFKKTMQFNGVDPKDFATILEGFDEESPRSDGTVLPPMSKALFPERYEQGWRLSKWPNQWLRRWNESCRNTRFQPFAFRCRIWCRQRALSYADFTSSHRCSTAA